MRVWSEYESAILPAWICRGNVFRTHDEFRLENCSCAQMLNKLTLVRDTGKQPLLTITLRGCPVPSTVRYRSVCHANHGTLARTQNEQLHQHALGLRIIRHCVCHALPHATVTPPPIAQIHRLPSTELLGQIAPWATCSTNPENGLDKPTVVSRLSPRIAYSARQNRFDLRPNLVMQ